MPTFGLIRRYYRRRLHYYVTIAAIHFLRHDYIFAIRLMPRLIDGWRACYTVRRRITEWQRRLRVSHYRHYRLLSAAFAFAITPPYDH